MALLIPMLRRLIQDRDALPKEQSLATALPR
jgi:hypothetical protein